MLPSHFSRTTLKSPKLQADAAQQISLSQHLPLAFDLQDRPYFQQAGRKRLLQPDSAGLKANH
jgi:hypothetical protein